MRLRLAVDHESKCIYNLGVRIEFDPSKDAANLAKHRVSLAFGSDLFDDAEHIIIKTDRAEDGESRRKVIGLVGDRLWTAIFVEREAAIRFISVRRSNDGEARIYNRA